jgi:hypothetical protein
LRSLEREMISLSKGITKVGRVHAREAYLRKRELKVHGKVHGKVHTRESKQNKQE